jgi:segregation and condensation protein B
VSRGNCIIIADFKKPFFDIYKGLSLSAPDINSKCLIEAALFAAGKALSAKDLAGLSGLPEDEVRALAEELINDYAARQSGMEIRSFEDKYVMQVRAFLAKDVVSIAPREIDTPLIRTLAIIAHKQPIKQSDLAEIRGNKSYSHVKELERMGLISTKKFGRTKVLATTKGFAEYFGLGSDSPEFVRKVVSKSSMPLGVTRMYESLAMRLGLDYVVVNPYHPDSLDLERLKYLKILVIAPGYAELVKEHYSGEVIEAGVSTFSRLLESAQMIRQTCAQGNFEDLAAEINSLLQKYRKMAEHARPIKPLSPMIEDLAKDLGMAIHEDGLSAAPDYAHLDAQIQVPTHQPYQMDIIERIGQRCEKILKSAASDPDN